MVARRRFGLKHFQAFYCGDGYGGIEGCERSGMMVRAW